MSSLGSNDAHLHYEDGSHRWQDPQNPDDDGSWRTMVEAHMAEHQSAAQRGKGGNTPSWPGRLRSKQLGEPHA